MADEGKSLSTPKQRLLDAKNQADMYMKEERAAEVAHFAHSMSESLINNTLTTVMSALPIADAKATSPTTNSSSREQLENSNYKIEK